VKWVGSALETRHQLREAVACKGYRRMRRRLRRRRRGRGGFVWE
jgi:hypothetical protein